MQAPSLDEPRAAFERGTREQALQDGNEIRCFVERMASKHTRTPIIEALDALQHSRHRLANFEYSITREQEILRVDVASGDEAACLLGTSTGIRRVHESALVVHEAVEVAPSASETL